MFTATIGQACSSCNSTSSPFASVCLVNGMFTNGRLNPCSLDGDQRDGGGSVVARDRHFRGQALCRSHERARRRRAWIADEERHAAVAALPDRLVDRNPADERHAEIIRHLLPAAVSEDV